MAPQPPDSAAAWARELATTDGNRPQQLPQHLYALQQRYAMYRPRPRISSPPAWA